MVYFPIFMIWFPYRRRNILLLFFIILTLIDNGVSSLVQYPLLFTSTSSMVPTICLLLYALINIQIFMVYSLYIISLISLADFVFTFSSSCTAFLWRISCLVTVACSFSTSITFPHNVNPFSVSYSKSYMGRCMPVFSDSILIIIGLM